MNVKYRKEKKISINEVAKKMQKLLKENQIENFIEETIWILEEVMQLQKSDLYKNFSQTISHSQKKKIEKILKERIAKKPLAYILGNVFFWKYKFFIIDPVLIPRKESELLLEVTSEFITNKQTTKILEVGCGSGIISLCLALEHPLKIIAIDSSQKAIFVSKKNQKRYSKQQEKRKSKIDFLQISAENFLQNTRQKFNFLISNPPYIAEKEKHLVSKEALLFEDKNALFSSQDGLYFYYFFAEKAKNILKPNGKIILEHGWQQKKRYS